MYLNHHNIICARILEHSTIMTYSNSRNWAHEKKNSRGVPGGEEKWGPQFGFGCPKSGKRRWKKQLKHWKQHLKLRYLQRKGFFSPFGLSACNEMISLLPSFWSKQSTKRNVDPLPTLTFLYVYWLNGWKALTLTVCDLRNSQVMKHINNPVFQMILTKSHVLKVPLHILQRLSFLICLF